MSDEIDQAKENLTQADIDAVQFKIDKTIYELRNQDAFEGSPDQQIEVEQYKANKNWDRTLFQYSDVPEIVHHLIVDMNMRITPELKRGLYNNDCEYALSLIAKKELAIDLDQKLPVKSNSKQQMKMKI